MTSVLPYKFVKRLESLPSVDAIFLFGSRTQTKHSQFSDIDLAITCPTATAKEWQKILDIVDDADTLLRIDCVRYDKIADQKFKKEIDQTKQVLYAKNRNPTNS